MEKIDRYEIRHELGHGGMATVYFAYDPRVGREVAVKVLLKEFMNDPMFRERFEREVKSVVSLEHPAIVPVYDYGEDEDQPYLVMRYMSGGSLADRLKGGALDMAEAGGIVARIGSALEQAHARGIIHRDLKPGNILFDQYDNAFLSDFGIVKLATSSKTLTSAGGAVGTPAYMSPEQVQGDADIDGRADVYAMGAIFFEMLTGATPYESDTPMGLAVKHVTEPVPSILSKLPDVPETVEEIIRKAMAKKRDERYTTASEMVTAVLGVTGGDLQKLMQSGTVIAAGTGPLSSKRTISSLPKSAPVTGPGTLPVPSGTEPALSLLKRFPLWGLAAAGVVGLLVVVGIIIGLVAVLSGGGGSATPEATETLAAFGGTNGEWIAFSSNREGGSDIYLMSPDGATVNPLLADGSDNRSPDWSPDGTKIVYRCQLDNRKYICVVNADGSGKLQMTDNSADNTSPTWSPDGTQIAFVSERDGNPEIYVMNADGSNPTRLTNDGFGDFSPDWTPDGNKIVFDSNRDGNLNVYIVNTNGSDLLPLTDNPGQDYGAKFSPDGGKIVFVSERGGAPAIYVMNPDGTEQTALTGSDSAAVQPTWSPDGKFILFSSRREGNAELYRMNPDGTGAVRLTELDSEEFDPVWQPQP